jgi:hypothetical protein
MSGAESNIINNNVVDTKDDGIISKPKGQTLYIIAKKANDFFKYLSNYSTNILVAAVVSVSSSAGIMYIIKYFICFFYAVVLMIMAEKNDKDLIVQSNTFIDSLENFKQSFSVSLLREQGFGNWIINTFNSDIFFNFFKDLRVNLGNDLSFKLGQFKELENYTTEEVTPKFEENIGIIWIVFIIIVLAIIKYLNPSTNPIINLFRKKNKRGGGITNDIGDGKPNDIDELIQLFIDKCPGLDKYPGLNEYVDDILQYLVDIIGTIDKSNLEQTGIKPEDISKINIDYIKHIKLSDVKDFEVPKEFFDDINSIIDIFIGQLKDIKAGAEERVEQMEEMKQSEANVRYGKEFQVTSGSQGMRVGSMGGKQKRSRKKHNKSKSAKRKHSRKKHSRRKHSRRKHIK